MKKQIWLVLAFAAVMTGCAQKTAEAAPEPMAEMEAMPAQKAKSEKMDKAMETAEMPMNEPIPQEDYMDVMQGNGPDGMTRYSYMIKPNDYLTKIAFEEYGNPNEWRSIYSWNREKIGDDPNLIYPYRELDLYKDKADILPFGYDFRIHVVAEGESLWRIAGDEYGDEKAWIVIFWDNQKLFDNNGGRLKPGMELQIRTSLWPGN